MTFALAHVLKSQWAILQNEDAGEDDENAIDVAVVDVDAVVVNVADDAAAAAGDYCY